MLDQFVHFLDESPTSYHANREISTLLAEQDFTPLDEKEKWCLEPGKSYFVVRDDTLLTAFRLPKETPTCATLLVSHIDSPALKIKPKPEIQSQEIGQLGTELYGAPLLHTWLDRDLAIAGRIVVLNSQGTCESRIVLLDDYPILIPGLAIHLNHDLTDKGLIVQRQDHLKAIYSIEGKGKHLENWLKKHHSFQHLLSFDLFLVPLERARFNGLDGELISSYRLDNLSSVFASLKALLQAKALKNRIQMAIFWDHEEIGSKSYTGADSFFMSELFERISLSFKMGKEDYYRMKSSSLCISCDVAHGYHPNYPEKYDIQNAPVLGKGVAVKFSMRYATNGSIAAPIIRLAEKHNIPLQTFALRSDQAGGSTVGPMMSANLGIPTIDLGLACWAMHSIRETISAKDQIALGKLLQVILEDPVLGPYESF